MRMSDVEFSPLARPLDKSYIDELVDDGIMPAGVVGIIDDTTDRVYALQNAEGRISGLPVIDLASATGESHADIEGYVQYRIKKRFGFELPNDVVKLVPVESNISARMDDLGNRFYPDLHHRMYFPFLGRTGLRPGTNRLGAFSRKLIMDNVVAPQDGDVLFQLFDIHREILFNYSLEPVKLDS